MRQSCVKHSQDTKLCQALYVLVGKRTVRLGVPGKYTSVRNAFEAQARHLAGPRDIAGGTLGACAAKPTSFVVRALPRAMVLPAVMAVKLVELVVLLTLLLLTLRAPLPATPAPQAQVNADGSPMVGPDGATPLPPIVFPRPRVAPALPAIALLVVYYLAMAHYHVLQAMRKRRSPATSDTALATSLGVRSIESMEALANDKILVVHDGGRTLELEATLKPSKRGCGMNESACLEYRCCAA